MVIKTVKELDKALEILSTSEIIAFDFETMPSGLFPEVDKKEAALHHKMCELEGLALRSEKLDPIYIPISDTEIPRVYLTEKIGTLFSQESLFVAHNIQFDAKIADYFFGARPKNKFCTLVGYWYLDENTPKDAKTLGKKHFDIDMIPYDEAKKLGEKDFYDYAKRDAEVTYRLYFFLKEALEENYFDLASTLEMNFIDVLIDMTLYGTPCDFKYLKEGERILTNKVLELEAKIYKELGEFNINSPQQLCEKLYGIKIKRKKVNGKFLSTFEKVEDYDSNNYAKVKAITETGAPSTKEEALEKIDTPAAKLLKEYRGIMKLLSTYAIGYQKYVIDNKIYPTFNNSGRDSFQYGTVTGRLCVHPDTLIEMPRDLSKYPDGVPLRELAVGDIVYSFDEDKELCLRKVKWVGPTKPKRTLIIHTDEGQFPLIVSHTHLIRKYNGDWCYAKNLKIGDRLLCMPKRGFSDGYSYFFPHSKNRRNGVKSGGKVKEHRFIALDGKPKSSTCLVHHKDENKLNNHPENLEKIFGIPNHKIKHSYKGRPELLEEAVRTGYGKTGHKLAESTIKIYERRLRRNHVVTKIEEGPEEQLWDLEIEDTHTFIGNDIALHNSSSAPNMQNISHEPTEGWWLREAIYAKDGYKLIVADEAQLEMRLLAHFSKDPHLIEAIKSGEDIHLATAKIIFGKEEISSEERRFAKCVSGDTRITTGGGISKIQDISSFRREDDYIDINKIVWDGNSWVPATKFYYSGYKRAKKISFSKGYTLTCSLEHPVMTKEGWKKAKELQLNDEVLLGKGGGFSSEYQRIKYNFLNKKAVPTESSPTVKFDEYWARMLGYILGDGCTTGGCMVSICNGDDSSEVREDISNLCKELGLQEREWKLGKGKTKNLYLGSTNFHNFLEASGLFLGSKKVFSVPEIVFHSPKSVVKEFLRGLFETDGWVEAAGSVGFCSKSKQLCQDIQILLLNFGIISSIDESYNTAYQKMYWKIRISGYYSQIFSKEIGFISTRKQTLLDGIQVSRNMISQYVKVKAIEDVESELFDLVVPSTNSFVGNGLVCHNTQNFSTAYGQGIIAMANQLGCSKEEAKKFRFKYFDTFPKIKKYIDRVGEKLEQNGYVKTVLGRKRRIPEVYSNESGIVARAKRQGVNSIIQGSAADVLKAAMVKIHSEFKEKNLDAHILLQIHDELVIECKEEQVEEASAIVKEYMEHPLNKDFRVPLEVEPKICKTWAEGKD